MDEEKSELIAKVPQVTFLFWVVKVLATTLGETAGDAVTMSWLGETTSEAKGTGYLIGTGIFGAIFVVAVLVQIRAKRFHPFLYWLTIVATTTVGTTLADYCTRSLGIGYTGGSTILLISVIASLLIWRWSTGSISIETVSTPKVEIFYWVTIMFSQTLGTALGDWVADTNEMGYLGAAARFRRITFVDGSSLLPNELFARHFVLGCIHFDSPARSYPRRFSRQTDRARRPRSEPLHRNARALRGDRRPDSDRFAKARFKSALISFSKRIASRNSR